MAEDKVSTTDSTEIKKEVEPKQAQNEEDGESGEEQPLDIGEHYVVQRSDETWRMYNI